VHDKLNGLNGGTLSLREQELENAAVEMGAENCMPCGAACQGHDVTVVGVRVHDERLVLCEHAQLDLAISTPKDQVLAALGPDQARDCCRLQELVADALLVGPLVTQPVRAGCKLDTLRKL
jgi:hypothetical protein